VSERLSPTSTWRPAACSGAIAPSSGPIVPMRSGSVTGTS
jgi:hypothetical protein